MIYRKNQYLNRYKLPFNKFPDEGTKISKNKEKPCLAEKTAEEIRERMNYPDGKAVPVMIDCPCPDCSNRVMF